MGFLLVPYCIVDWTAHTLDCRTFPGSSLGAAAHLFCRRAALHWPCPRLPLALHLHLHLLGGRSDSTVGKSRFLHRASREITTARNRGKEVPSYFPHHASISITTPSSALHSRRPRSSTGTYCFATTARGSPQPALFRACRCRSPPLFKRHRPPAASALLPGPSTEGARSPSATPSCPSPSRLPLSLPPG